MMEKIIELESRLDEWVNCNLGAGNALILGLLCFIALVACWFVIKRGEVRITDNGDGTETWDYRGERVIVEKGEEEE